jgi:hypothetical protein
MTVGSRIVFMHFSSARSPKLNLWNDHFHRVVGQDAKRPNADSEQADDGAFVWHLISANSRMLARGASIHATLEGAMEDTSRLQAIAGEIQFRHVCDKFRGPYGWYAAAEGIVALTCARWYATERDRRSSIELTMTSLSIAILRPETRLVQPEVSKSLR